MKTQRVSAVVDCCRSESSHESPLLVLALKDTGAVNRHAQEHKDRGDEVIEDRFERVKVVDMRRRGKRVSRSKRSHQTYLQEDEAQRLLMLSSAAA